MGISATDAERHHLDKALEAVKNALVDLKYAGVN
jgi:hypothetical protein